MRKLVRCRGLLRGLPAVLALGVALGSLAATPTTAPNGAASGATEASARDADMQVLASYRLLLPVAGIAKKNLHDTYHELRGNRPHEALDIPAPRGTPVVAVGDGRIVKLYRSGAGGLTVYQFDPSEKFAYYYAHLDRYARNLAEGMTLKRGDPIGAVGSTGNAREDAPHLHFAIFKLGPAKQWWKGAPVNPFPLF